MWTAIIIYINFLNMIGLLLLFFKVKHKPKLPHYHCLLYSTNHYWKTSFGPIKVEVMWVMYINLWRNVYHIFHLPCFDLLIVYCCLFCLIIHICFQITTLSSDHSNQMIVAVAIELFITCLMGGVCVCVYVWVMV